MSLAALFWQALFSLLQKKKLPCSCIIIYRSHLNCLFMRNPADADVQSGPFLARATIFAKHRFCSAHCLPFCCSLRKLLAADQVFSRLPASPRAPPVIFYCFRKLLAVGQVFSMCCDNAPSPFLSRFSRKLSVRQLVNYFQGSLRRLVFLPLYLLFPKTFGS